MPPLSKNTRFLKVLLQGCFPDYFLSIFGKKERIHKGALLFDFLTSVCKQTNIHREYNI